MRGYIILSLSFLLYNLISSEPAPQSSAVTKQLVTTFLPEVRISTEMPGLMNFTRIMRSRLQMLYFHHLRELIGIPMREGNCSASSQDLAGFVIRVVSLSI